MTTITFYFDFLSPYAYYARHRLVRLADQHGARIDYRAVDLQRLKQAAGNTAPPTVKMPRKLAYALRDFERWGQRYGIPVATSPACFDVQDLNVGVSYAAAHGKAASYVEAAFDLMWGRSGVKESPEAVLQAVASRVGLNVDALRAEVVTARAAQQFDAAFEEAIAHGVFGVPSMVIDGELWWGNDRLFMVEELLAEAARQPA